MKLPHLSPRKVVFSGFCGLLSWVLATGCTVGPKRESDRPVDLLNGQKYQQQGNVLGVPILKRQATLTQFKGQLLLGDGNLASPLPRVRMALVRSAREIAEVQTDGLGYFNFAGDFVPGVYSLRSKDNKYFADQEVQLTGDIADKLVVRARRTD